MAATAKPAEEQFIDKFGYELLFRMVDRSKTRPLDTAMSAATQLVQLAGASRVLSDEQEKKGDENPENSQLNTVGRQLYKEGKHRSCYKWFAATLLIVPPERKLKSELIEEAKEKYGLQVRNCNTKHGGRKTVALIDVVTEEICQAHIDEIVSPDYDFPVLEKTIVISSATYFHPWWNVRFNRKNTTETTFHESPQRTRQVSMMYRDETLLYSESKLADGVHIKVVALDCRHRSGTVYFLLPSNRFGLREMTEKLTGDSLDTLISSCSPKNVKLWVPKFLLTETVEIHKDLMEISKKLGSVFDVITEDSQVIHHTTVRMNEDGEKPEVAETTTAVQQIEENKSMTMRLDHPFLFIFRHAATNGNWLAGSCSRPFYPPHK